MPTLCLECVYTSIMCLLLDKSTGSISNVALYIYLKASNIFFRQISIGRYLYAALTFKGQNTVLIDVNCQNYDRNGYISIYIEHELTLYNGLKLDRSKCARLNITLLYDKRRPRACRV